MMIVASLLLHPTGSSSLACTSPPRLISDGYTFSPLQFQFQYISGYELKKVCCRRRIAKESVAIQTGCGKGAISIEGTSWSGDPGYENIWEIFPQRSAGLLKIISYFFHCGILLIAVQIKFQIFMFRLCSKKYVDHCRVRLSGSWQCKWAKVSWSLTRWQQSAISNLYYISKSSKLVILVHQDSMSTLQESCTWRRCQTKEVDFGTSN